MKETTIISRIKPKIRALSTYKVKELDYDVITMNKNENPYDLPQELKKEILDYALKRSWSRYPPIVAEELYECIAGYTGWTSNGIVAGNGSDEMILTHMIAFLEQGKKLVIPSPSFPMFSYMAELVGADVIEVPLNPDFSYDCDALEDTFLAEGDMLVICSPNNPTGTLYPIDRIEQILKQTTAPVIVDEAYYEFSKVSSFEFLKKYENLIIFRTFSKAFSLAGLRLGYALMNPELAVEIGKVKLPFNIDFFSIAAACKLLKNKDKLQGVIDEIVQERDKLMSEMCQMEDIIVYPSAANFILFKTPYNSSTLCDTILEDGILVRDLSSNPVLANTLRVTVSKPEDNKKFIGSLSRGMEKLAQER